MNMYIPKKKSSLIKSIGFDGRDTLELVFVEGGTRYRYYGVATWVFLDLLEAKSLGKYYNKRIKGQYKCRRYKTKP